MKGILIAGTTEVDDNGVGIRCQQGPCDWYYHSPADEAAWDALRRHSYAEHNPEGKPYPHEEE